MWVTRIGIAALLVTAVFPGCREVATPQSPTASVESVQADAFDHGPGPGMRERLAELGIDIDDSAGLFSLGWRAPRANAEDQSLRGHAMGVVFGEADENGRRPGIDVGTVSLAYGGEAVELRRHERRRGGVAYTSRGGRDVEPIPIQFMGGMTYQFRIAGSDAFEGIDFSVTTPAEPIDITSPSSGDAIDPASDLVIRWQGGGEGTTVVGIAAFTWDPAKGPGPGKRTDGSGPGGQPGDRPRGRRGFPPANRMHEVLDTNTGEFTVTADALAELIGDSGATRLGIHVFQVEATEIDHNGDRLWALLRTGDHVRVTLESSE